MFGSRHNPQKRNNFRFYIIGITILIAAIFIFFFLNRENFSGATVAVDLARDAFFDDDSDNGGKNEDNNFFNDDVNGKGNLNNANRASDDSFSEGLSEDSERTLSLTFDQIPTINTETDVDYLAIAFTNPSTTIRINNDRLDLGNLPAVDLNIESFSGDLALNENSLSLDGTVKKIEVNGVMLSSKDELEISFQNLYYNTLNVEDVELPKLTLTVGEGELHLGNKLTYILHDEEVDLETFQGSLFLGKDANALLRLEGLIDGFSISGEEFNLNLN